jgi:hypothetical protein
MSDYGDCIKSPASVVHQDLFEIYLSNSTYGSNDPLTGGLTMEVCTYMLDIRV